MADDKWYIGTADAVYQNIDIIESYDPRYIVILAGDHVYKMDFEPMLQQHVESGADVTVGCLEVPRGEATGFGVMQVSISRIASCSFWRNQSIRPRCRGGRTWRWRVWGFTCSRRICLVCCEGCRRSDIQS